MAMHLKYLLKSINQKTLASTLAISLLTTGCATSELLSSNSQVSTKTTNQTLVEDQVVAFGKPSTKLPNMPSNSIVIVGEKNSYVLSDGGTDLVKLLTTLDPKNINVDKELRFYSPKNDGYFSGTMELSYAKLKDEFKRSDLKFFLQENGKECTTTSDRKIGAQRFCFSIPIKGGVFPQVSNIDLVQSKYQSLTKPYSVSLYTTNTSTTVVKESNSNPAQKLVLLPFALAFDVITLPLQILD